ncbi:MAG: autoinducer binding domain-containing protein [Pseudomonadota bacterium]|jgi:hypothetical protein|nr:autoinducer binding domain-containing protein [Alphaproteobacteria bacterium]
MLGKRVKETIEEINDGNCTKEKSLNIFHDICSQFYIEQFALAVFSGKKNFVESFQIYETYSKEWMQRYKDKGYHLYDPVFSSLQKVAIPFEWDTESFENVSPLQRSLMKEAREFGVCSGLTIPLIPRENVHGFVTILNNLSLHPDALYMLYLIGNVCVNKIAYLENRKKS